MKALKDLLALLVAALALAGAAATYGAHENKIEDHGKRLDRMEPQVQQNSTDSAVLKEAVEDIRQTVHELRDRKH